MTAANALLRLGSPRPSPAAAVAEAVIDLRIHLFMLAGLAAGFALRVGARGRTPST